MMESAVITNIQGYSIHDGPGIRTVVFIKGCPLRCKWCANPENLAAAPDIGFVSGLCKNCARCAGVCENKTIISGEGLYRVDRDKCVRCFRCSDACFYSALVRYGEEMTAAEVCEKVSRDKMFYDSSGGGVTLSGGEPLTKPGFVAELFACLREAGIDTCVETCGFVPWESFETVLPVTDRFYFDIKLLGLDHHRQYTGADNTLILDNARKLAQSGAKVTFRRPIIPGVNDDEAETAALARFLLEIGLPRLELMPYHRMGLSKYSALNMEYTMTASPAMEPAAAQSVRAEFEKLGIDCTVSK